VYNRDCPALAGISSISRRKTAIDCSDDAPTDLVGCIAHSEHELDEAKLISGNEPEFARAVALLLHEAALIDRYLTTSSKHTARTIHAAVTSG
jgi:hypothetical protein